MFNIKEPAFDPPYLQFILQAIFVFAVSLSIAYIAARAYLASGSINILLLGSAIFISGLTTTIGSWAVPLSANEATTIGNVGIFVSSLFMLASAVTTMAGTTYGFSNRKAALALLYLSCLAVVVAISLTAAFDLIPDFLTPTGPTSIRLVVLTISIMLYVESSLMFGIRYWRLKSSVVYWYSLALTLFSIALVSAIRTMQLGDLANWVSRLAIYFSGVYFLIALLSRQARQEASQGLSTNWANAFRLDSRQSEQLFSNMHNGFMYCKMVTDSKGEPIDWIYLDVNNAFEKIMGFTKEQVIGKTFSSVFPGEPKELLIDRYGQVALTCGSMNFEIYRPAVKKWLNISAYCPKRGYFVSIFEDVTERKKAEEALKQSEDRMRAIAETSIVEISVSTFDGRMLFVNDAYADTFGFSKEELIDFHTPNLYVNQKDREQLVETLKRKGFVKNFETQVKRKDGTILWVAASIAVIDFGGQKAVLGVSTNITERKKAQEALRQSKELFSKAFHSISFPISLARISDNQFVDVNDAFLGLIGFSYEEVIGHTSKELDIFPKYGMREEYVRILLEQGSIHNQEIEIRAKSGEIRKGLFSVDLVNVNGQQHMLSSLIDITEQKRLQKDVEVYTKNLESLVEQRTKQLKDAERLAAIGATAGMVGHDIRNPLQAITSDIYLAKSELALTSESEEKKNALESLTEVEKNIDYINKIVQDLQDYARPLNPKAEESDLKLLIAKLLEKNSWPDNIELSVKVENSAKKVTADSYYINRILYNLVINGVQAMPNGGKLTIHAFQGPKELVLIVSDTGVGIPKDIRSKLFTPMFTTKAKGQGFGLPVVKRMTESLGGTVTFESQEGKGTTFTVRLPLT